MGCRCGNQKSDRPNGFSASETETPNPSGRHVFRRVAAFLQWLVPSVALALIPKCPACLAAYVAIWSGFGISFAFAAYLRWTLIGICIAAFIFIGWGNFRQVIGYFKSSVN